MAVGNAVNAVSIIRTFHVLPEETVCLNCRHFYQHFVQYEPGVFASISYGHCSYPRNKARKALDTCEHFTKAEISDK